ncbi:hypothetical protein ASG40_08730 [Methylobacterium sp. Leaf399]|uniref:hypothetical protein n=1 Tax=unclassified Methylobacterium TaxID=2615210 RepID=UPI0006FFC0D7|nr:MULTISPECIES: hypothetical protein [unclassified Methylobacterium]KQP55085.1 hypothetical protein ASF39_04970 [Methylobacterium sp. Leaf108]KQT09823.1 hypothetical protein ASG40_08730 [Methylobacterium sp. Leaf399]KQT77941.1 hypothetical protein ASG59_11575 [Methylobacterium sp. Leaf466]
MNKLTLTLAASLMLGGLGLTTASAAPAVPAAATLAEGLATTDVAYRGSYGARHRHGYRNKMRRRQPRMMSDPNSRNPSQPGYQQQKGNTSGGPRY